VTQRNKGPFRSTALLNVEIDLGGVRRQVGRLAWRDRVAYFEYDQGFLTSGLDLSPFRLKLGPGLMEGPPRPFDGLHGLFNDSLPDGWGRLLMDSKLHQIGLHPGHLTPLDRLAWIGAHGMGALIYHPEHPSLAEGGDGVIDLDKLAGEARKVLNDSPRAVLDELLTVGGSPQGARPKALVGLANDHSRLIHGVDDIPEGFEHWLVKFRAATDPVDIGAIENAYADMAGVAGVDMLRISAKAPRRFGFFHIFDAHVTSVDER
jgi:serine/threonine-protein kinase HipA